MPRSDPAEHPYWRYEEAADPNRHGAVLAVERRGNSVANANNANSSVNARSSSSSSSSSLSARQVELNTYVYPDVDVDVPQRVNDASVQADPALTPIAIIENDDSENENAAPPRSASHRLHKWVSRNRSLLLCVLLSLTYLLAFTLIDVYLFRASYARSDQPMDGPPPYNTRVSVEFGIYHWCVTQRNIDSDPSLLDVSLMHADIGCYTYAETCGSGSDGSHASDLFLSLDDTDGEACRSILADRPIAIVAHLLPFFAVLFFAVSFYILKPSRARIIITVLLFDAIIIAFCIVREWALHSVRRGELPMWPPSLYKRWNNKIPSPSHPFTVSWGCFFLPDTPNIITIAMIAPLLSVFFLTFYRSACFKYLRRWLGCCYNRRVRHEEREASGHV